MNKAIIELKDVWKIYQMGDVDVKALQGLTMSIKKGEFVANAITDLIIRGGVKVKMVWKLITDWLGSLPGMNKYFLEQEIKIKTDRVMEFSETAHS